MRWNGIGMTPETGMAFAAFWATVWIAGTYVQGRAESSATRRRPPGAGLPRGAAAPQPGHARLLGTSSGFVFLWWPTQRRAEAVPIESVARLADVAAGCAAQAHIAQAHPSADTGIRTREATRALAATTEAADAVRKCRARRHRIPPAGARASR